MAAHCGSVPTLRQARSPGQFCAALDHVAKQAMFSCDTELDRWSALGFCCVKLLSLSAFQFGLGHLPSTSAPRLIAWSFPEDKVDWLCDAAAACCRRTLSERGKKQRRIGSRQRHGHGFRQLRGHQNGENKPVQPTLVQTSSSGEDVTMNGDSPAA